MTRRYVTIVLLFCLAIPAFSQNISHEFVKKGIEAFYEADFEEAMRLLQSAIINEPLGDEEQFYAHLYVGFCHIRMGSGMNSVQLYFQKAITILPQEELDPIKIPPDLYNAFVSMKRRELGTIIVHSEPLDANVMLIEPATSRVDRKKSPAHFDNLRPASYQVLVSKSGYDTFSSIVDVQPGGYDTLNVILFEGHKSFFAKYWAYGAGALVATAAIFAITTGGGDEPPPAKPPVVLPDPPDRP